MFKLTLKELAGKKLRLITTALAVMLGVAFMAGTLVLTDTIGKSFDGLFAEAYSGMDAYVRGERVHRRRATTHRRSMRPCSTRFAPSTGSQRPPESSPAMRSSSITTARRSATPAPGPPPSATPGSTTTS